MCVLGSVDKTTWLQSSSSQWEDRCDPGVLQSFCMLLYFVLRAHTQVRKLYEYNIVEYIHTMCTAPSSIFLVKNISRLLCLNQALSSVDYRWIPRPCCSVKFVQNVAAIQRLYYQKEQSEYFHPGLRNTTQPVGTTVSTQSILILTGYLL